MSCCSHWHHGPWCGPPRWWYEQTAFGPPLPRRRRDRQELEDHLAYLEEELKRVREELAESKSTD